MSLKRSVIFLSSTGFVLLGLFSGGGKPVNAAPQGAQVSSFHITTIDGKSVDNQTLMAGATYNIKFTIEIASGINNKVVLKTDLLKTGDHLWSLDTPYQGIDTTTWQPGQSEISFNAIQGTAQFELQGSVPVNYVLISLQNGENLHISKAISLVQVSLAGDTILDNRTQKVVDSSIDTYQSLLSNRESLVKDSKADSRYIELVNKMVASAQKEGDAGYTERASAMLQSVPTSGWIPQQSSNLLLWIIIGILAVLTLGGFFLTYKARTDLNFVKKRTDDQAKRLEIIASRIRSIGDANLAGEVTKVKQDLEEMSDK